ncbi:DnaJ homolog subfamily A member 2, putative [Trypanosoma cruzi]|uniref:DnaJ homolog subfamily A member 2, putative n=1 Tax=Trypanosoma cruzi (strain CL Brener) TaxID=353153 RepID=Q4DYH9_TRYCC|nr:DnaJ homolog subfamily A member 2, putative [Trypanosoma cruzi]EAN97571.1 DnaJ homolog subfamily A member 2, putative [Trypanosoma cruzi]|eukprot:XP_819422.1 DnaJ homolog subfamily A member 2 [Trypanosoma cruzi strain CL Brener]
MKNRMTVGPHHELHYQLQEALCGFELPVQHLDRRLRDKDSCGQVIDPGAAWVVRGEGMPLQTRADWTAATSSHLSGIPDAAERTAQEHQSVGRDGVFLRVWERLTLSA